ncbi:FAD-binding oxidoreductase [Actinoplanes sp. NPDC048967]|uniref:FAD-binding oxidoreductase n=1 Tax=Actinoplanes sp. NPDC048967 TaxID=3155269 RepID=UPI0033D4CF43
MPDLTDFRASLDGELTSPDYARRGPRPRLVVLCRSISDVVNTIRFASTTGDHIAVRGGGHCFAGRSSTDGIVLDTSGLDGIAVADDGVAVVGAGSRLGQLYTALHTHGRTLPAGCGPTVGIAGLTLGGGIGLLGRRYGLTCDRLVAAQIVLADGSVVNCDQHREPDLFWALRGAGGGQFGVVTALLFDSVEEPTTTRIEAHWPNVAAERVAIAWQDWAPDAPDELTVNLTLATGPGVPVRATLSGAATLGEKATRDLLRQFTGLAGAAATVEVRAGLPYLRLKETFADPRGSTGHAPRIRSEFFSRSMSEHTLAALLARLRDPGTVGRRQLTFTAMGGAYNRVAPDATAFTHRRERFLLEHIGEATDPWVDDSWAVAHADGSGHVYPNFPDPALDDWATAYHGDNYPRLLAVKDAYDPRRLFTFPQAVSSAPQGEA